jgi:regulator of sigma E protease
MELLSTILIFVVVLGILVTVHELGHFLAARMTGMRADTFAVGMGGRVLGFNTLTGFTFGSLSEEDEQRVSDSGATDYRIAMLPIGGYVKIAGMIDESMDTDYLNNEPKPYEFRSKNAAQKIFVMSAGVIMNILLAIAIFTGIAMFEGKTFVDTTTIAFVEKNTVAEASGFKEGDKIIAVNGEKAESWMGALQLITKEIGDDRTITVERGGSQFPIKISGKTLADALSAQQSLGLVPQGTSVMISGVETLKPAGKLGLLAGDTVLKINDVVVVTTTQLVEQIKSNKGNEINIEWKRGAAVMSGRVTPDTDGRIGVAIAGVFGGGLRKQSYGFLESFSAGTKEMMTTLEMYIGSMAQLFKGKVAIKQAVGGPIQIAKMSKQSADLGFTPLLRFMAVLSVILAVMNILPFPALDGGHIVFILIETIIRREIPVKIKMGVQQAGIVLLLCFMVFVFYNDLTR